MHNLLDVSEAKNAQITFEEKPQIKVNSFQKQEQQHI